MQIFDSYIQAGKDLPKSSRKEYYAALVEYLAYGTEPQLKGGAKAVMTAIMPSLKISRQNSINGRIGGKRNAKRNESESRSEAGSESRSETQANGEANGEAKREANGEANSNSNVSIKNTLTECSYIETGKRTGKRNLPSTAPCPICGAVSEHVEGNLYRCPSCDDFGAVWELAC